MKKIAIVPIVYVCDNCGKPIKQFKAINQRWRVGCPYCNRAFDELDIKLLKKIKGDSQC